MNYDGKPSFISLAHRREHVTRVPVPAGNYTRVSCKTSPLLSKQHILHWRWLWACGAYSDQCVSQRWGRLVRLFRLVGRVYGALHVGQGSRVKLTWAGAIGLILVAAAVVGAVAQPSLWDTAVVQAFKLVCWAAAISWGEKKNSLSIGNTNSFESIWVSKSFEICSELHTNILGYVCQIV